MGKLIKGEKDLREALDSCNDIINKMTEPDQIAKMFEIKQKIVEIWEGYNVH